MINFIICILSALVSTVQGDYTNSSGWKYLPEDCGRSKYDNISTRIIKGDQARLGEFPWMARLGRYYPDGELFFFCGAVLINRFYVISAAHCEERVDVVRLGEHDANSDVDCATPQDCAPPHQDFRVKGYYFEDYCQVINTNDLMVLELAEPVKFNEFVQPVCIPRHPIKHEDLVGEYLTLAGWGRKSGVEAIRSRYLKYIVLEVLNTTMCEKVHKRFKYKEQICLEASEEGQNVCYGDSGGPAFKTMEVDGVRRTYAFGVASYVRPNCKTGVVYTSILFYLKNILDYVKRD
ncbi:melanization protease 1-like [Anoplophora glabripennis]|uniref:melanization protease 1-like n=1 Tax=Anoplophora glabripennis TaxID=217634 RepID=UPI000873A9A8|nr:melanization protease 1-like [Anoplophora glabripennis]